MLHILQIKFNVVVDSNGNNIVEVLVMHYF